MYLTEYMIQSTLDYIVDLYNDPAAGPQIQQILDYLKTQKYVIPHHVSTTFSCPMYHRYNCISNIHFKDTYILYNRVAPQPWSYTIYSNKTFKSADGEYRVLSTGRLIYEDNDLVSLLINLGDYINDNIIKQPSTIDTLDFISDEDKHEHT